MTEPDALFGATPHRDAYGGRRTDWHLPDEPDRLRRGPGAPPVVQGPEDAKAPAFWVLEAEAWVLERVRGGRDVSADDLRARFQLEPSASKSAVGALFRRLNRRGEIRLVGHRPSTRPERRGGVVGIWRSTQ